MKFHHGDTETRRNFFSENLFEAKDPYRHESRNADVEHIGGMLRRTCVSPICSIPIRAIINPVYVFLLLLTLIPSVSPWWIFAELF